MVSNDDAQGRSSWHSRQQQASFITGITIARIANGQIVQGWDNWDQFAMLRQIGAIGKPRAALTEGAS